MAQLKNTCLGYELLVTVPDTVEDFDKAAGKPNAALDEAIKNVIYRSWNAEFRGTFLERVEKETGVKWPIDQKATDKQADRKDGKPKTPIHVSDGEYFDLVLASGFTKDQLKPYAEEVAATIAFDPSASARTGGKIGKEYLAAAESLLAKDDTALASSIAKLESLNPGLKVDLDDDKAPGVRPSKDTLAKAVKVNQDRKLKEAMAELE